MLLTCLNNIRCKSLARILVVGMDSERLLESFRSLSDDIYLYVSELEAENARLTANCQQLEGSFILLTGDR